MEIISYIAIRPRVCDYCVMVTKYHGYCSYYGYCSYCRTTMDTVGTMVVTMVVTMVTCICDIQLRVVAWPGLVFSEVSCVPLRLRYLLLINLKTAIDREMVEFCCYFEK